MEMPFEDESFDTVISNGSLHEWENPIRSFNEIYRVLRPGGRYCITDLRRDVHPLKRTLVYLSTQPKEMRPGFITSLNAAYTASEITELLRHSNLCGAKVTDDFFGLCIAGEK
jgi:ubiquinone/menaquinone biosynthesis C-methylase UbiE